MRRTRSRRHTRYVPQKRPGLGQSTRLPRSWWRQPAVQARPSSPNPPQRRYSDARPRFSRRPRLSVPLLPECDHTGIGLYRFRFPPPPGTPRSRRGSGVGRRRGLPRRTVPEQTGMSHGNWLPGLDHCEGHGTGSASAPAGPVSVAFEAPCARVARAWRSAAAMRAAGGSSASGACGGSSPRGRRPRSRARSPRAPIRSRGSSPSTGGACRRRGRCGPRATRSRSSSWCAGGCG